MAIVFDEEPATALNQQPSTIVFDEPLPTDNQTFLGNLTANAGRISSAMGNVAEGVANLPSDIYQTGKQIYQGQPISQTPLAQDVSTVGGAVLNALPSIVNQGGSYKLEPGAIYRQMEDIAQHPIQQAYQNPIDTALAVAPVVPASLGLAKGIGAAVIEKMAPEALAASAQDYGMKALGFTKRFLGNDMALMKARQSVQTILNEGIITSTAGAETLAKRTEKLAEDSGKAIGDYLKEMNSDGNFLMPQQLKASLEDLRPIQQSTGKILRGGQYNSVNNKIDNALETIDAHGDAPISWEEANQLKGTFQDAANWKSNKDATVLDRVIAGKVRETLDNALQAKAQQMGNLPQFNEFLANKQKYSAAMTVQDPLYNRISSELGNNKIGLTDYVLAAGALTQGRIGEAMALLGGKKILTNVGPSTAASVLNKAAQFSKSLGLTKSNP
jgi:predicted RNA-binding Zn ribbon-like protein